MQKRAVQFWAQVREMPEAEVMRHIGEDRYQAIRAEDATPMFIGLDVGYEGQSKGEVAGFGNQAKHWVQTTIQKLGRLLNGPGDVALYEGHAKSQSESRQRLGQIVSGFYGAGQDNLTHAYAVGYVQELQARARIKAGELDACSVEAECLFEVDGGGKWHVQDVRAVGGVALANSKFSKPGFAGAGIVAVIQELEAKGDVKMDREEIRKAIQNQGLAAFFNADELRPLVSASAHRPSVLFDRTVLGADPVVQQIRDEGISSQAVTLNDLRSRNAQLETQIPQLRKQANKGAALKLVAEKLADKALKLSVEEKGLIQTEILAQDFDAEGEAKLKVQVETAVDAKVQYLGNVRKLYGKTADVTGAPTETEENGEGGEGGEDAFLAANADKKAA